MYDPDTGPDRDEWLALDEQERIDVVFEYHLEHKDTDSIDQPMAHAIVQAAVETQVVLGDATPVAAKLAQLIAEGLDRHGALHAIGSVLAVFLWGMIEGTAPGGDVNAAYFRQLEPLSAESWLAQAERAGPAGDESVS